MRSQELSNMREPWPGPPNPRLVKNSLVRTSGCVADAAGSTRIYLTLLVERLQAMYYVNKIRS